MLVLAFDRDWTVDVNPHPDRAAVPLEWVRHWAHETDHEVWAIGNQALAREADVPGIVELVERTHERPVESVLGEPTDGRYPDWPLRRERLRMLAGVFPDADGYVVVDDLDLSDVDGWDHYHAWEFVPAVERGAVDLSPPGRDTPRTDGGVPSPAGVESPDLESLRGFLAAREADAYELAYRDGGDTRTRLAAAVGVVEASVERPSAAVALECVGLPPGTGRFRVRLDDLASLRVVPPDDRAALRTDTPRDRAAVAADTARVAPDRVDVAAVVDLLGSDDGATRDDALAALAEVADARPDDCLAALPAVRELLADADHRADALAVVAAVADARPGEVAPFADELVPALDAGDGARAAECLSAVADHDPADVVDAVPALAALVADRAAGTGHALYALNLVAGEVPAAVRPAAPALGDAVADTALGDAARQNATAALGRVAGEFPDVGVEHVDAFCTLLAAEDPRLRANAAGALADVATHHAPPLESRVDDLAPLLSADDEHALVNASGALARVAETSPDAVAHLADRYLALLDHDHRLVRENACWALGHLGAERATGALRDRRDADEVRQVRERAAWALREIRA